MLRKIAFYWLSGAIALIIHYGTLIVGVEWFALAPATASGGGFVLGAGIQYAFNYFLTFNSTNRHQRAIPRYAINVLLSLSLNVALMHILVSKLSIYYLLAQLWVTFCLFMGNYFLGKRWVYGDFRNEPES